MVFPSLRWKLVASYSAIILLCLVLAGFAFVYLLRDYQRQIKLNQLSDLSQPISWQVRLLERSGASPEQMSAFLQDRASEMNVRILLVDQSGLVVDDTTGTLEGERLQMPTTSQTSQPRQGTTTLIPVIVSYNGRAGFVFVAAPAGPPSKDDTINNRASRYTVVLAVPEQSLTASWLELAPSLSVAAMASLIVSIFVAFLLSRSISHPIVQITRASEEMAKGRYDQHISVHGRDEVARLGETFNRMAHQVDVSHRTMRDFLANVSHDLRTPLTSIQGFSQAILDGTAGSATDQSEAAAIISEEAERMQRLVEELLLLSKIESGQLPLDRAPLDLRELLRASVRRAGAMAQQKGISLSLEAAQPATIDGDESRLEQLFTNLIDNALTHTPSDGAVTIALSSGEAARQSTGGRPTEPSKGQGRLVRVSVHNTGSYIPAEDQERIFERFYQVDKSRTRSGNGIGLGLAISQEIAHAHGAEILVQSDREKGTTFTVVFGRNQTAKRQNGTSG